MSVAKRGLRNWLGALGLAVSVMSTPLTAEEYAASFKNTDINEFIQVVGRNLGKTIIIDPNVRGKIDVRSYDVMNEEQYFAALAKLERLNFEAKLEKPLFSDELKKARPDLALLW